MTDKVGRPMSSVFAKAVQALMVIVAILWIASLFLAIHFNTSSGSLMVSRGVVSLQFRKAQNATIPQRWTVVRSSGWPVWLPEYYNGVILRIVRVPIWMLWLSLLPILIVSRKRANARLAPLACRQCGYDCAGANRDICPECGTIQK